MMTHYCNFPCSKNIFSLVMNLPRRENKWEFPSALTVLISKCEWTASPNPSALQDVGLGGSACGTHQLFPSVVCWDITLRSRFDKWGSTWSQAPGPLRINLSPWIQSWVTGLGPPLKSAWGVALAEVAILPASLLASLGPGCCVCWALSPCPCRVFPSRASPGPCNLVFVPPAKVPCDT